MQKQSLYSLEWVWLGLAVRSKADETLVIVETLICPLQISHLNANR